MRRYIMLYVTAIILFVVVMVSVTFAWYINVNVTSSPIVQSENIDGLTLNLYRGYDFDFNGALDSLEPQDRKSTDLNDKFIDINYANSTFDKVNGLMDGSIITYRLVVNNDTEHALRINPYFEFLQNSTITKYNASMFNLEFVNVFNHTYYDKNGVKINEMGETHLDNNKDFYTYLINDGLYDTYGNPIKHLTDGANLYTLEYDENNAFVRMLKNGVVSTGRVNLTKTYIQDIYDSEGNELTKISDTNIYQTKHSNANAYKMQYNSYNTINGRTLPLSGLTEEKDVADNFLSYVEYKNQNLAELMYKEKYSDGIIVDSYSRYYVDIKIRVNFILSNIKTGIDNFATMHNVDAARAIAGTDTGVYDLDYKAMYDKYIEFQYRQEISNPNFRIQYFYYDIEYINLYSSYFKNH